MILAELIDEFVSGDWGNEECSDDTPNAVSCIRAADFEPILSVDYSNIPTRYISDNSYQNKLLKVGDIIIEKSGGSPTQSTGRVILVTEELLKEKQHIVCSNFCEAFRVKKEWSPFYVFCYLQFLYKEGVFFNFEGKTSGLKNLQMEQAFNSIDIPEQKSDISILTSIDEKIALNRKINIELESLANEIYDYWFVQFDFPNEDGKPYKSFGGKMVWNETLKRDIPDGWSDGVLEDIANITMGQSPDGSSYNADGDGTIFYQGSTDFGIRFPKVRMYTTAPSRLAKKGDILMSVRAPVGTTNIANCDCCIGRGLAALNSSIGSITYLYQVIKDLKAKFDIINNGGTTFGAINKDELHSLIVTIPDEAILSEFESISAPIFEEQMKIGFEIEELQSLRDFYLPLLMNGQVTIKD